MSRTWWALLAVAVLAAAPGLISGCADPPAQLPVASKQVRDRAVEWPSFDPVFVEGDDFIFAGDWAGSEVVLWVHASIPLIGQIYEESGPEKGWLMTRHALSTLTSVRVRSPLNMLMRMEMASGIEERGGTTVARGTVTRLALLGSDLPAAALDRFKRSEAARSERRAELVLAVSTATGALVSLEISYPQPTEPIVETYTWRRAGGHTPAPEDPVELKEWWPYKEALSLP